MRKILSFNNDWRFIKTSSDSSALLTADSEAVTLPHTWNAADGQDGGNDYYRGTCRYIKEFAAPDMLPGERLYLEFPAAAMKILPGLAGGRSHKRRKNMPP